MPKTPHSSCGLSGSAIPVVKASFMCLFLSSLSGAQVASLAGSRKTGTDGMLIDKNKQPALKRAGCLHPALLQAKTGKNFLVSIFHPTHIAAETILVEFIVSFAVPKAAGIRRNFICQNDFTVTAAKLQLEID